MLVTITAGGFGLHGPHGIRLVLRGEELDLPDALAAELIARGAAAAHSPAPAETSVPEEGGNTTPGKDAAQGAPAASDGKRKRKAVTEEPPALGAEAPMG